MVNFSLRLHHSENISPDHEPLGSFLGSYCPDAASAILHNSATRTDDLPECAQSPQGLFGSIQTHEELHKIHNLLCKIVILPVSSMDAFCHKHIKKAPLTSINYSLPRSQNLTSSFLAVYSLQDAVVSV